MVAGEDGLEMVQEGLVRLPILSFQQLLDNLRDLQGVALLGINRVIHQLCAGYDRHLQLFT